MLKVERKLLPPTHEERGMAHQGRQDPSFVRHLKKQYQLNKQKEDVDHMNEYMEAEVDLVEVVVILTNIINVMMSQGISQEDGRNPHHLDLAAKKKRTFATLLLCRLFIASHSKKVERLIGKRI